jgi:hypothetical protein
MPLNQVRLARHAWSYTEPRGASTLANTCALPPHAGESSYALANLTAYLTVYDSLSS